MKKISVVVPVFNEIGNIKQFHEQLLFTLRQLKRDYEIIYVDDKSTDGTFEWLAHNMSNKTYMTHVTNRSKSAQGLRRMPGVFYRRNGVESGSGEVKVLRKVGKKGKAFSLQEGFDKATGAIFVMIDGDLQYPINKIPEMIQQLDHADIVVAERKKYHASSLRKLVSKTFRALFGKALFGLSIDVQSGLKVFTRKVYKTVHVSPSSAWTFDLEFLHRAQQAGFTIAKTDITFAPRSQGQSNVNVLHTSLEIGFNALLVRLKRATSFIIPSDEEAASMRGAGVIHKKKTYITHTTLPLPLSALKTFSLTQKLVFLMLPVLFVWGLVVLPMGTLKVTVALLSILYFIDTIFNLYLVLRSLKQDNELQFSDQELRSIDESTLPVYTILCPLYKEAHVVPQFLEAIAQLDYPKNKLDVMFLLEEDDTETIEAFSSFTLPYYARTVVVPHSMPKTKPKACNYGLSFAKGEYLVIYDAEDIPDPLQLKKAYLGFQKSPKNVQCLQAKLNYYNSRQNLLTRFFTAEYSLWFDVTLTGLQSLKSTIPLGGTSNHFRTQVLRDLQGWDPFNVTEDADLGIRLFYKGFQTAIIDSTTFEEATSRGKIWLKQRSRWLKGYMQTYLVHMRNIGYFIKEKGLVHNAIFQLTVGGKILFILINPLLWMVTMLYFWQYKLVGPLLETIYVPPISYLAVFSWVFGNFLFVYYYMIGAAKRKQWDLVKYVFLIPAYWLMLSTAGMIAFYQLLFKPHYWEKTTHGFHLGTRKVSEVSKVSKVSSVPVVQPTFAVSPLVGVAGGKAKEKSNIEYLISKQYQNTNNKKHFGHSIIENLNLFRISNLGFRTFTSLMMRFAPIVVLSLLDLVGIIFLLDRSQASLYLLLSLVVKVILLFVEFIFVGEKKSNHTKITSRNNKMKILIFNWRDTKHVYAGGAEVYIHELAKRWVKDGNSVTLFAGNDRRNVSYEKIQGVEIYRRGGTYTVYLFAFLYYLLKFRGRYDVIIDCENGIPFFTPLFARKPIILLIHHVHQEVFRTFLRFPLKHVAAFLEGKLMPFVYNNKTIVTVSPSSRREIFTLGFTQYHNIEIVTNGVNPALYVQYPKTQHPSFVYMGRLKAYKNVDVAIKAFAEVLRTQPTARFAIVGWGESNPELQSLVRQLGIAHAVTFYGKVSEREKAKILSESWAAIQPSQIEGWGITVIEANAAGTPVIASRVNGLQDSVIDGQTGFLVEVGSVTVLAQAMQVMINDAALRMRLSDNAYRWSRNFDWDNSAAYFYSLIGKVLGQKAYKPVYGEAMAR